MFLIRRGGTAAEAEALGQYVDALIRGLDPVHHEFDPALGVVARALRRELRRPEPNPNYVEALRMRLIAAADQRGIEPVGIVGWRQPRFIIGAASLVSAAAVIALVARSRIQARAA